MLWLRAAAPYHIHVGSAWYSMAGMDAGLGHGAEWSLVAPSHEVFQPPACPKPSWRTRWVTSWTQDICWENTVTVQMGLAAGCLGFGSCSASHQLCAFKNPQDLLETQGSPPRNGYNKILPTSQNGKCPKTSFLIHTGLRGVKTAFRMRGRLPGGHRCPSVRSVRISLPASGRRWYPGPWPLI